ncbi:MAG: VWA domain-containing protein [Solobacterium sp.]|nr:VWA domain-containing protein [Solobacterium sp.]
MKKNLTEIVFIIDRSGSMGGLESDTIGGYNSFLERQKKAEGEALVSTVLFNNRSEVLHDRVNIADVQPLGEKDYMAAGTTALLDAIGGAVHHIGNIHKYARDEDRPEHTVFVIITDGMENASRLYDYDHVQSMISRQQERFGWEFLFLGANIDAVKEAGRIGISADHAVRHISDKKGTELNYRVLADAVSGIRRGAASPSGSWKKEIERDYRNRGKQHK